MLISVRTQTPSTGGMKETRSWKNIKKQGVKKSGKNRETGKGGVGAMGRRSLRGQGKSVSRSAPKSSIKGES